MTSEFLFGQTYQLTPPRRRRDQKNMVAIVIVQTPTHQIQRDSFTLRVVGSSLTLGAYIFRLY